MWKSGVWAVAASLAMVAWIAYGNLAEDEAAAGTAFRSVGGTDSGVEQAALESLLSETHAVLRSEAFERNLAALDRRHPVVYANPQRQSLAPSEVAEIVALKKPGARYGRVEVQLVGGRQDPGGWVHASAGEMGESGRYAGMAIGRGFLELYRSSDVVERSCAINVAAHEYAHTISTTPIWFTHAFTDTTARQAKIPNRRHPGTPVASYLIGSVAQCTWLQAQGRIAASDVPACVEVFGTAAANDARCRQFRNGQPVALRPDLAPAASPL
ncbi:MAG: hypothetical protein ACK41C_17060 [Phenylobacterium sp.]|uniref:hypothetical protein n=1 Tax=Phenylobacterium sp. TaxID=1871053 RepID=UPI00391A5A9C